MHRPVVVVLFVLFAAVLGGFWWLTRGDAAPPPLVPDAPTQVSGETAVETNQVPAAAHDASGRGAVREAVAMQPARVLDDPEIRAGLSGFKGRVVDHRKTPVADCGVRIYRGAMDSILPEGVDLFAEEPTLTPQYVAGEARTAPDGTFSIGGVWPRAFYLLFAGIGTDAPMHQIVTRTPAPGEIVDLGDIELPDAGVIVGTVLDDNGDPLAGALVRAADLPGSLAAFFPVERFDPQGAVLIREAQSPVRVVEMPAWVKAAFDNLPIPSSTTDAEGRFRLVGVIPGSNLLATTARDYLSDMKPSIQVRAGQVKDVGKIKLKRGEELLGRVLDSAGKPVADAEVFAGSTLSVAPVDLAQRVGTSDAEGRFQAQGFSPGKVTVAARRGKGHAWVLAEPQPILGDVLITLPATFGVLVAVQGSDGKPATSPRFRLLQGRAGDGAAEMAVFGFVPPIDLRDRMKATGEGQWRIENLGVGKYTLVADAPGHATAFATFDIQAADANVSLQLPKQQQFLVRVLSHEDKPIRNVAIYAEGRGRSVFDMPLLCGRTDAEGRFTIDKLQAESVRVSGDHPRWGVVHGEVKVGEELVLRMQQPGMLRGTLTEDGKPATPGKFTVALERRRGSGPRGPIEEVPALLTPGLDGTFTATALQPGQYRVGVIKSLDAMRSPGGVFALAQEMFLARDLPSETVEVVSGQTVEVQLDAGQKPIEGPTAHLFGTVTVDGKMASGYLVSGYAQNRRFSARVDDGGRFDLGVVPAGHIWVSVMAGAEGGFFSGPGANLWSGNVTLAEAEAKELAVVVSTSSMAGTCYLPDGSPAAGVYVQAQGQLKGVAENSGNVWMGAPTDSQGNFRFAQVAEGTWSLQVRGGGDRGGRGKLEGIVVTGGQPVESLRIELTKGIVVKGRIDVAAFGAQKPQWCWVQFYHLPKEGKPGDYGDFVDSAGGDGESGEFSTDDLQPGTYRVQIGASFGENEHKQYRCDDITVPPEGVQNLVLRPGTPLR